VQAPPAIQGLGSFSGVRRNQNNNTIDTLLLANQLIARGNQALQAVFTTFAANAPQLQVEIDRNKARALQVPVDDVLNTMQNYLGARYINDFNLQGRTYRPASRRTVSRQP